MRHRPVSDYDAFERLLGDIQAAYLAEDLSALRAKVTPEMPSYFSEQLAGNASRGLINRVTDVKLLQGDLAEAWREGDSDYATVPMKFALKDSMVERASGRTVEGGEQTRSGIVDLHARVWRQLAALRHPADLMFNCRADKWHAPRGRLIGSRPPVNIEPRESHTIPSWIIAAPSLPAIAIDLWCKLRQGLYRLSDVLTAVWMFDAATRSGSG